MEIVLKNIELEDYPYLNKINNISYKIRKIVEDKYINASDNIKIKFIKNQNNISLFNYLFLRLSLLNKNYTVFNFIMTNYDVPLDINNNLIFRYCCKNGWDNYVIKLIYNNDVDPFCLNSIAVYYGVLSQKSKIIDVLLKCSKFKQGDYCNIALYQTCIDEYMYGLHKLLKKCDFTTDVLQKSFYYACVNNRSSAAIYIYNKNNNLCIEECLTKVCSIGNVNILELLVEFLGADPTYKNNIAMQVAITSGKVDCVRYLLKYNIDVKNIYNNEENKNHLIDFVAVHCDKEDYRNITYLLLLHNKIDYEYDNYKSVKYILEYGDFYLIRYMITKYDIPIDIIKKNILKNKQLTNENREKLIKS
jgi:hypothetical protein